METQKYIFDMEKEAEAIYQEWLHLRDDLNYVDIVEERKLPAPENKALQKILEDGAPVCYPRYLWGGRREGTVFLTTDPEDKGLLPTRSREENLALTFDHETAHALYFLHYRKNFCEGNGYQDEDFADTFSLLRQYQRFGTDTSLPEHLLFWRSADTLFYFNGDHFTAPVIDFVIQNTDKMSIGKMTLKETADLTFDIMAEARSKGLLDMKKTFKGFDTLNKRIQNNTDFNRKKYFNEITADLPPITQTWARYVADHIQKGFVPKETLKEKFNIYSRKRKKNAEDLAQKRAARKVALEAEKIALQEKQQMELEEGIQSTLQSAQKQVFKNPIRMFGG